MDCIVYKNRFSVAGAERDKPDCAAEFLERDQTRWMPGSRVHAWENNTRSRIREACPTIKRTIYVVGQASRIRERVRDPKTQAPRNTEEACPTIKRIIHVVGQASRIREPVRDPKTQAPRNTEEACPTNLI